MRAISVGFSLLVALTVTPGCVHSREVSAAATAPPPGPVWPGPPAAARVRLLALVTRADPAVRTPWWKIALRYLTGTTEDDAPGTLARPFDVAVREDGSFVVADPERPGVLRYAADGSFAAEISCPNHAWSAPMAVAAGDDGAIWVADAGAGAVVRWSAEGCAVLHPAGVERPTGIALTGGRIVIADPPSHQVVALSPGGEVVSRWGERGEAPGQFNFPTDVASAPDGSLYVVDALNFRIAHLSADGKWLGAFGAPGEKGSALARPKGIDVDASGLVYVTDAQRDMALVFRADGTLEYAVGETGTGPFEFAHPAGLSVRGGRLAVADSVNGRVGIFEILGGSR